MAKTDGYFSALRDFDEAPTVRHYKHAAAVQARGMPTIFVALEEWGKSPHGLPFSMPLIDAAGRAVYALYPEDRTLAYVEALHADDRISARVRGSDWVEERDAVAAARLLLREAEGAVSREAVL